MERKEEHQRIKENNKKLRLQLVHENKKHSNGSETKKKHIQRERERHSLFHF